MPTYAYRCRDCDRRFDVRRSISAANEPATCPEGHGDTVKLLTTVSLTGSAMVVAPAPAGGCCGGGCCST